MFTAKFCVPILLELTVNLTVLLDPAGIATIGSETSTVKPSDDSTTNSNTCNLLPEFTKTTEYSAVSPTSKDLLWTGATTNAFSSAQLIATFFVTVVVESSLNDSISTI